MQQHSVCKRSMQVLFLLLLLLRFWLMLLPLLLIPPSAAANDDDGTAGRKIVSSLLLLLLKEGGLPILCLGEVVRGCELDCNSVHVLWVLVLEIDRRGRCKGNTTARRLKVASANVLHLSQPPRH